MLLITRIKLLLKVLFFLLITVSAGLIVTLMPAPLPAIKSQAQCIWRAHHMAVVPPTIVNRTCLQMLGILCSCSIQWSLGGFSHSALCRADPVHGEKLSLFWTFELLYNFLTRKQLCS